MGKVTVAAGATHADDIPAPRPSVRELRSRLRAELADNDAYLAADAPTAAQTRDQVRRLTAQVSDLVRLLAC